MMKIKIRKRNMTIVLLSLALFIIPLTLAVNDPGHDTLYIEEQGDSDLNGTLNITQNITVNGGRIRQPGGLILFGDDSTPSPGVTYISGTSSNDLYLDGQGNVYIKFMSGGDMVYIGGGTATDLNISGALYVQSSTAKVNGQNICLQDGTGCPAGANATGNITGVGLANRVAFWIDSDTLNYDGNLTWNNSNKRLGIGTTSPLSDLQVGGNSGEGTTPRQTITIPNAGYAAPSAVNSNSNGDKLVVWNGDPGIKTAIGIGSWELWFQNSGNSNSHISFYTSGSSGAPPERVRIDSSGNVGIGYTSPTTKLDVNGTINATNILINGTPVGTGGGNVTGSGTANRVAFWTDSDTLSYDGNLTWNNSNKRLGIGTTSPESPLHLVTGAGDALFERNSANANSLDFVFRKSRGSVGSPAIVLNNDGLGQVVGMGYDGTNYRNAAYIKFAVDNTPGASDMPGRIMFFTVPDGSVTGHERMRIDSSGNVGIGYSSPTTKLDVNGTINATNILINGTPVGTGSGGGNISGFGSSGTLAKFTGADTIGNSIVSESGNTLTINGNISMPTHFYIGNSAAATNTSAVAIGTYANAPGYYSVSIGRSSDATGYVTTAVGFAAQATNTSAIALGRGAEAHGAGSSSLGVIANATGEESTAIGASAQATGYESIALGYSTQATGYGATAISRNALASGSNSIGLGRSATATNTYATALGAYTDATGQDSTALGYAAQATANYATAVGDQANATVSYTTAVGFSADAKGDSSIALGRNAQATGAYSTALGVSATAQNSSATAIGNAAYTTGQRATAIGYEARATGMYALALGDGANATGITSTAIGTNSQVPGYNSIAIGYYSKTTHNYALAIGRDAQARNDYTISIGDYANTTASYATAIGYSADAKGSDSLAMLRDAQALHGNSVALGRDATTTAANQLMIGSSSYNLNTYIHGNLNVSSGKDICLEDGTCLSTVGAGAGGWTDLGTTVNLTTPSDNVSANTLFIDNTNGRVGIGTSNPDKYLHIYKSDGNVWVKVETGGTAYALTDYAQGSSTMRIGVESTSGGSLVTGSSGSSGVIGTINNYPLYLITNNAIKTTIDSSGKVGIGTTSPSELLHIYSGVSSKPILLIEHNDSSSYPYIRFSDSNEGYSYALGLDDLNNKLSIGYASDTNANPYTNILFTINTAGNVGIGTISPQSQLHVEDGVKLNYQAGHNVTFFENATSGENPSIYIYGYDSSDDSRLEHWKIYTDTYGNLWIDNDNSGSQLILNGASTQIYSSDQLQFRDPAIHINSANDGYLDFTADTAFRFNTGNVGIGTTSPSQKLHVNGNVNVTGYNISTVNCIVFDSGGKICTGS